MMPEIDEREAVVSFTGIGIPAEVFLHPALNSTDMKLFGLVRNISKSNRGCWATNRWLGNLLRVGPKVVSESVANLTKFGFIKIIQVPKPRCTTNEVERRIYIDETYTTVYRALVEAGNKAISNGTPLPENYDPPTGKVLPPSLKSSRYKVKEKVIEKDLKENSIKEKIERPSRPLPPEVRPVVNRPQRKLVVRPSILYLHLFPAEFKDNPPFKETWYAFERHRVAGFKNTPFSEVAAKMIKTELLSLSKNDINLSIKILERSIRSGWKDVYGLSNSNNKNQSDLDMTLHPSEYKAKSTKFKNDPGVYIDNSK